MITTALLLVSIFHFLSLVFKTRASLAQEFSVSPWKGWLSFNFLIQSSDNGLGFLLCCLFFFFSSSIAPSLLTLSGGPRKPFWEWIIGNIRHWVIRVLSCSSVVAPWFFSPLLPISWAYTGRRLTRSGVFQAFGTSRKSRLLSHTKVME